MDRTSPSRRDFLKTAGAATLSALAAGYPRALLAAPERQSARSQATADAVILLWMAGGMAHTETFDPKRHSPFAPGTPSGKVLSTFPSIPTAVDTIRLSEGLAKIGAVMDRGTLIRSYRADLRQPLGEADGEI